jgi:dihydrofolate reductase
MNKNLSIIVASTLEYGIGFENKLCWNIPEEMKYFRNITLNCFRKNTKNCIIMGKNTWYSLPKAPLKDRINVIISLNDYDKIEKEISQI